uniref:Uncharacterized protein n=1 Tax=Rousettus aegyptiacus TaxID=9407 RepID=A0A7J8EWP8_ROUAE|nr:hypothetical protein HJG63_001715 [Rousettus aegyptiacus]
MEALVYAFSELRIREDGVSWARGLPSHPDTPPNIYEGMAWPLDLPQGTVSPGNSHHSSLLEARLPRGSLGNTASSSSTDPAKGTPSQPGPPESLGLRPKRSWGPSEESTCPLCKRTRSGALERPQGSECPGWFSQLWTEGER